MSRAHPPGPLLNAGATCFANATVRALSALACVRDEARVRAHACWVAALLAAAAERRDPFSPAAVAVAARAISSRFFARQQDASDLLARLCDAAPWLDALLGADICQQKACTACGAVLAHTHTRAIWRRVRLGGALESGWRATAAERVEGLRCARCGDDARVVDLEHLDGDPRVIALLALRWDARGRKIAAPLDAKRALVVHHTDAASPPTRYTLRATVSHHGTSPAGGHYTAQVAWHDGERYACDDRRVSAVADDAPWPADAYLLFYEAEPGAERAPRACAGPPAAGAPS